MKRPLCAWSISCRDIKSRYHFYYKLFDGERNTVSYTELSARSNAASESDLDARQNATSLQRHVERQIETDSDLSLRLEELQPAPDEKELDKLDCSLSTDSEDLGDSGLGTLTSTHARGLQHHDHGSSSDSVPGLSTPETFEAVLSATRVYDRVRDRGVDDRTSIATTRSHAWSVFSGLSLAEISIIAVIQLPLHKAELQRFREIGSPSWNDSDSLQNVHFDGFHDHDLWESDEAANILRSAGRLSDIFQRHYGLMSRPYDGKPSLVRLKKELSDLEGYPPRSITAGPMEDALVCVSIRLSVR